MSLPDANENMLTEINYEYNKLNWFKKGWYRKFKKTEFIKSCDDFDRVYYRAIIAKERFCNQFGYDEDDMRPESEYF